VDAACNGRTCGLTQPRATRLAGNTAGDGTAQNCPEAPTLGKKIGPT
jgi:hypothetical protein